MNACDNALDPASSICFILLFSVVCANARLTYPQAKKFLADVSPDYMTARTKKTELALHHKCIGLSQTHIYESRAPLDLPTPPILGPKERSILANWRKYLEFEESNPLEVTEKSMLNARVMAIYRKAVIKMRFYPEIWSAL